MAQRDEHGLPVEGEYSGTVRMTEIKFQNDKPFVEVSIEWKVDGVDFPVAARVYLTEAAAGIARGQFRAIGFDPDRDPQILHDEPLTLNGNEVRGFLTQAANKKGEMYPKVDRLLPPKLKIEGEVKSKIASAFEAIKAAKDRS